MWSYHLAVVAHLPQGSAYCEISIFTMLYHIQNARIYCCWVFFFFKKRKKPRMLEAVVGRSLSTVSHCDHSFWCLRWNNWSSWLVLAWFYALCCCIYILLCIYKYDYFTLSLLHFTCYGFVATVCWTPEHQYIHAFILFWCFSLPLLFWSLGKKHFSVSLCFCMASLF